MKTEKSVESFQPGKLVRKSEADIRRYAKSPEAKATSERLRATGPDPSPEDLIEMPELTDEELDQMRPVKQLVTVRIDTEILDWLKSKKGPYQTRMNAMLRAWMLRDLRRGR